MTLRVRVSARAATHIATAEQWWAENRPSAPGAIRNDLAQSLALLAEQPGIGNEYRGTRLSGVRRLHEGRIRYFINYRVTHDTVDVLAVWHVSRGKKPAL